MDERPLIVQCVVRSIPCSGPIELYSFPSVLHNWCNKGRVMYYSVCGMVHIKEPLLANQRVAHVVVEVHLLLPSGPLP